MHHSYWEKQQWGSTDHAVIGAGFVGLFCALALRKRFPQDRIVILERGYLPTGASTRNAGFACFGSVGELEDDLKTTTLDEVLATVELRYKGLRELRRVVGDDAMDYQPTGGWEALDQHNADVLLDRVDFWNRELSAILGGSRPGSRIRNSVESRSVLRPAFAKAQLPTPHRNFYSTAIFNSYEGALNPARVVRRLQQLCQENNIEILTGYHVTDLAKANGALRVSNGNFEISTQQAYVATNGFARQLLDVPVTAVRNQVILTAPVQDMPLRGTFHSDRGYYYWRNLGDRLLLGGARHKALQQETTDELAPNASLQQHLLDYLQKNILPGYTINVDHEWSGILGVGEHKQPLVKRINDHLAIGIRQGGMGVAIASQVGRQLAGL